MAINIANGIYNTDDNNYDFYFDQNGTDVFLNRYLGAEISDITVPNSITYNEVNYNVIGTYGVDGTGTFTETNSIINATISQDIQILGEGIFHGCSNLISVTIPNSVTSIGNGAFYCCSNLTNITIPDSINAITYGMFFECRHLNSVIIPNNVNTIASDSFAFTGLTSITIPNSVTSIGNGAFDFTGLTSITIPFIGYDETKDIRLDYAGVSNTTLEEVTVISGNISNSAFKGYRKLTNITFPENIISIGGEAFASTGLTNITIPNSVTSIGSGVFAGCSNLTNITIPNSVTSIGSGVFSGCSNLTNITIPNSVTSIKSTTFFNCTNLNSVEIPNSVTTIGYGAFYGCSNLTNVIIPNSVIEISSDAFYNDHNIVLQVYDNSYALQYAIDNNINYEIIEPEPEVTVKADVSPGQYFLAGVANAEIFKGNDLFATAKTLIDSSITIGVSAEDIRAGQGAKLYGKYFHTSTFDLKMTDAMFRLEYIAANVGSDLELGGDVFTEEEININDVEIIETSNLDDVKWLSNHEGYYRWMGEIIEGVDHPGDFVIMAATDDSLLDMHHINMDFIPMSYGCQIVIDNGGISYQIDEELFNYISYYVLQIKHNNVRYDPYEPSYEYLGNNRLKVSFNQISYFEYESGEYINIPWDPEFYDISNDVVEFSIVGYRNVVYNNGDIIKVNNLYSYKVDERELVNKEFVLKNVPKPLNSGSDQVYIYWKNAMDNYYKVKLVENPETKIIDMSDEITDIGNYCVKYLYTNDAARKLVVKANFTPDTLSVYLTANLYSGDSANPSTGTKVGTVTIKVPRFLLNGSQEINMSMTGAANTPFEGSALATKGTDCDGDGIYAEIIEIITGRTYKSIVDMKIQDSDDILYLKQGQIYDLKVFGRFSDSYFAKLDNSKLDFESALSEYVSVDSTGRIIALQTTNGVKVPIYAENVVSKRIKSNLPTYEEIIAMNTNGYTLTQGDASELTSHNIIYFSENLITYSAQYEDNKFIISFVINSQLDDKIVENIIYIDGFIAKGVDSYTIGTNFNWINNRTIEIELPDGWESADFVSLIMARTKTYESGLLISIKKELSASDFVDVVLPISDGEVEKEISCYASIKVVVE